MIDGTMKVYAWYNNECGYLKRMAELCHIVAARYIAGVEPEFKYEWDGKQSGQLGTFVVLVDLANALPGL